MLRYDQDNKLNLSACEGDVTARAEELIQNYDTVDPRLALGPAAVGVYYLGCTAANAATIGSAYGLTEVFDMHHRGEISGDVATAGYVATGLGTAVGLGTSLWCWPATILNSAIYFFVRR